MTARRTLTLRREVLLELTEPQLAAVNGAAPPPVTTVVTIVNTGFSCLAYISCNPLACVIRDTVDTHSQAVTSGC
jgi:hypothetical protein